MKTKNKRIAFISMAALFIICTAAYLVGNLPVMTIALQDDKEIEVEYGSTYNPSIKELVTIKNEKQEEADKIKLTTTLVNQKDKDYPEVGNYKVTITYLDTTLTKEVVVKDTTSPTLSIIDDKLEVSVDLDGKLNPNFVDNYKATDLSKTTITYDDSKVDYSKPGEYTITLSATDTSKNTVTKDCIITVVEKEVVSKPEPSTPSTSTPSTGNSSSSNTGSTNTGSSSNTSGNTNTGSTNKPTTTTPTPDPEPETPSIDSNTEMATPQISMVAINEINKHRTSLGLTKLSFSHELAELALIRAKEIQTDFSHDKFYAYRALYGQNTGECLAEIGSSYNNYASYVVNGWMHSTGHKETLTDEWTTNTEIAVAYMNNRWTAILR